MVRGAEMTHGARILIIVAGLLAFMSQAGAGEFGNPYSGDPHVYVKQQKARVATTPKQDLQAGRHDPSHWNLIGVTPTTSQASAIQPTRVPSVATPRNEAGSIRPLDVLDISVFQVPELTKTVQVAANGNIDLPLIGETQAAGKTPMELQRDLDAQLGAKYLQNPQVSVSIKESLTNQVTISGEVRSPGVYPVTTQTSLLQLVAKAGGFAENANSTVLVIRQRGGRRAAARFDVDAIQNGNARDPMLQAGDIIVAGTSEIKKGYATIMKVLPLATMFALF